MTQLCDASLAPESFRERESENVNKPLYQADFITHLIATNTCLSTSTECESRRHMSEHLSWDVLSQWMALFSRGMNKETKTNEKEKQKKYDHSLVL